MLQAAAAKAGVRTLVWHNHGILRPRPHHAAGAAAELQTGNSSHSESCCREVDC